MSGPILSRRGFLGGLAAAPVIGMLPAQGSLLSVITDAAMPPLSPFVTSLGTAAAFVGQGTLATKSSAQFTALGFLR